MQTNGAPSNCDVRRPDASTPRTAQGLEALCPSGGNIGFALLYHLSQFEEFIQFISQIVTSSLIGYRVDTLLESVGAIIHFKDLALQR